MPVHKQLSRDLRLWHKPVCWEVTGEVSGKVTVAQSWTAKGQWMAKLSLVPQMFVRGRRMA